MAAAPARGPDGNGRGCTNSWEEALAVAQLGEDGHQGKSGGPTSVTPKVSGSGSASPTVAKGTGKPSHSHPQTLSEF